MHRKRYLKLIILICLTFVIPVLMPIFIENSDGALRKCTNAEKALASNLRQQLITIDSQIQSYQINFQNADSKYKDNLNFGNPNSPQSVKIKQDRDYWLQQINSKKLQKSKLGSQLQEIGSKCNLEIGTTSSSKKQCSSSEKIAIQSAADNFQEIQANKRYWDSKLQVARAYGSDYSQPNAVRAQAILDFQKYNTNYQIELAKEVLAKQQFDLLNSSCINSGIFLPSSYNASSSNSTAQQYPNTVNGQLMVNVEDLSFNLNPNKGGFEVLDNKDGSFSVNCKKSISVNSKEFLYQANMKNAKLFVAGSLTYSPDFRGNVFTKDSQPKKFVFTPEKIYSDEGKGLYGTFTGKYVEFEAANNTPCNLKTKNLGDLTKTFAQDLVSISLILKLEDNPNYIFLGGVRYSNPPTPPLPYVLRYVSLSGSDNKKTLSVVCGYSYYEYRIGSDYGVETGVVTLSDGAGFSVTRKPRVFDNKRPGSSNLEMFAGIWFVTEDQSEISKLKDAKFNCKLEFLLNSGPQVLTYIFP